MKIITRAVLDWDGNILEQESVEYCGPVAACKSSGSAPQPVDPWQQAGAQYALGTGTANYNAGLNRTGSTNPLGSNSWSINGQAPSPFGFGASTAPTAATPATVGGSTTAPGSPTWSNISNPTLGRGTPTPGTPGTGTFGFGGGFGGMGGGAPLYTQHTSLTPWANKMLSSPIDTSGLAGMPGGPSTTADLQNTRDALYNTQEAYIKPQQDLAHEQLESKLANEGATPGSPAWKTALDQEGRENTFTNNQAINSAITGGGAEQSRLFGLGSNALQNQFALRNAPISEYEQLLGNGSGGQISAATPDISGAFNQQYQGKLAGFNADTATNNANTSAATSAAMMALLYAGGAF